MRRYSILRPLSSFLSGWLLNICKSSQRFFGSGDSEVPLLFLKYLSDAELYQPPSKEDLAFGLTACNSAVTPASFCTLIRKIRQPCSINSGFAGPCATFTRDS